MGEGSVLIICKFGENLNQSLLAVPTVVFTHWILRIPFQITFSYRTFQNAVGSKRLRWYKTSELNLMSIFVSKVYKNKHLYVL